MVTADTDPKRCPLCGQPNNCRAETDPDNCWCHRVRVPQELIDLVPVEQQRQACICLNCIESYNDNQSAFKLSLRTE